MPKAARRYDIYLPLLFNDGRPVPRNQFETVEDRLSDRFGGVTSVQPEFPLRGVWRGPTQFYFDKVIIVTVFDFRRQGSARFIAELKRYLLREFDQLEIFITESALRVH